MEQSYKITYISNAGVMVEFNDKKILIDGLCNSKIPFYKGTPAEIREKLILNIPPFNNIDIALFTHHHSDHFDTDSTVKFLKSNTSAAVICTNKIMEELRNSLCGLENDRLIKSKASLYSTEKFKVKGLNIEACSMLHDGEQYKDVENLTYIIEAGTKRIMHVGDAKPVEENYINLGLTDKNIDLLIAPFPYVSTIKGRQVVQKYIKPRKIIAVHLPRKDRDDFKLIDAAKKSYMRVQKNFVETIFFENILSEYSLEL